ncbi:MAG TPA: Nramp family divalent metal transporter [Ktedonobacteraceae bacterium]|nr:Nramp family divalent metal transporter [Ktedonobacteraceae bacterium]
MTEKQQNDANHIASGMEVETTGGDLGEADVSKPRVGSVVRDQQGNVEKFTIDKGVVFRKKLEVPADRIQKVEPAQPSSTNGKVVVSAHKEEIEALTSVGPEELTDQNDVLDKVETAIPTAEGLREMEQANKRATRNNEVLAEEHKAPEKDSFVWLRQLGPGLLGGMAGNDSSAVAAYSIDGAQNGFGHLWLLLLATPLYQSVIYTCAKLARITNKGLAEILEEHYGPWVAGLAAMILIAANLALIAADLVAVGTGLQLLTGVKWTWFVIPIAAVLWYLTVYRNFESIKKIFIVMSLAFVTYIITALLAHPNWGGILFNTFVPHLDFSFASISSAVALLGATISPYNIFWQTQGEKEEKRPGTMRQQLRFAALDTSVGVVSGNFIAYFIILSSAATLFTHHKSITTAADAAQALTPILGPFAEYLFAIGLIGAGLVAIPVLLASTSYAVAGTFNWPAGLSNKPWQNEGFYLILTVALLASLIMALLGLDPIQLLFWANVLSGVLAPVLVVYLLMVGNNRKVMEKQRLGVLTNIGLVFTALVMFTAALLLFYGLATGQGG